MIKQDPKKHHYIPCFYTKRWTGGDGMLCEFSKPYRDVIGRRKHPSAVGYAKNLYTIEGEDGKPDTSLETGFFAPVDQAADLAITRLISTPSLPLPPPFRQAFTGLLLSLLHRTPDRVEQLTAGLTGMVDEHFRDLKQKPREEWAADLPADVILEEVRKEVLRKAEARDWAKSLVAVISSPLVGGHTINMQWYIRRISQASYNLLTSDKPLIHYNGVSHKNGNLALPISPTYLFVATNNDETAKNILDVSDNFLVGRVNHEICRLARRYVYGTSESQLRFVENRLGMPHFPSDPPKGTAPPNSQWRIL